MSGALRRAGHLAEVRRESRSVIVNLARLEEQQVPVVLEGSSLAIWTLVDGTRSEAELVAALAAEYGVEAAQLAPDVRAFLGDLAQLGLLDAGS